MGTMQHRNQKALTQDEVGEFQNTLVVEVGHVDRPANQEPFIFTRKAGADDVKTFSYTTIKRNQLLSLLGLDGDEESVIRLLVPRSTRITETLVQAIQDLQGQDAIDLGQMEEVLQLIGQLEGEIADHLDGEAGEIDLADIPLDEVLDRVQSAYNELYELDNAAESLPASVLALISQAKAGLEHVAEEAGLYLAPGEEEISEEPSSSESEEDSSESSEEPPEPSEPSEPEATEVELEEPAEVVEDSEPVVEPPSEDPGDAETEELELADPLSDEEEQVLRSLLSRRRKAQRKQAAKPAPASTLAPTQPAVERSTGRPDTSIMEEMKVFFQELVTPMQEGLDALRQETQTRMDKMEETLQSHQTDTTTRLESVERNWKELDGFHPGSKGNASPESVERSESSEESKDVWGNLNFPGL